MGERRDQDAESTRKRVPVETMQVRVRDVLTVLDRVLRGDAELSEAYLLARDVVTAVDAGAVEVEDIQLVEPLRTLASARAINLELVEQIRGHLGKGTDSGTA